MTDDQEKMLYELLEVESGLTARQMDFIESLDAEWRERKLTDAQADWLDGIWNHVVGSAQS